MADSKISQLPTLIQPDGNDIVPIVDKSGSSFSNKKMTLDQFFSKVPSNTAINADLTVTGNSSFTTTQAVSVIANEMVTTKLEVAGNGITISTKFTPGSSSLDDEQYGMGKITFDTNYLYIKVSANTIKRVALSSF